MNLSPASILLATAWAVVFCKAGIAQHEGRTFMDLFNVVRLNPLVRLGVGVQLTFPISVFMPDLGILGRQSRNHFSQNFWPQKSSSGSSTCPTRGVSIEDYLHLLLIDEESCQELFVCEMSADPNRFMPVSEILLKKLSFTNNINRNSPDQFNTTEYILLQAAMVGADANKNCQSTYRTCPVEVTSMINMNILWGWQLVTKYLNIKFVGETEANVLE